MRSHLKWVLAVWSPAALIMLGASPGLAMGGGCTVVHTPVSVVSVGPGGFVSAPVVVGGQTSSGFVPTPLDMIAFPTFPQPAPPPLPSGSQVVVCPTVISPPVITPVFVSPSVAVDPPALGAQPPQTSSPERPSVEPPLVVISATVPIHRDTVADLVQTPARYDRQVLSLTGTVVTSQERLNDRDVRYTLFRIEEGGASLPVIAWGFQNLHPGQYVRVTGTFHDIAPFALAKGERPRNVLVADMVIGEVAGERSAP